jgi:hypothetical protein
LGEEAVTDGDREKGEGKKVEEFERIADAHREHASQG